MLILLVGKFLLSPSLGFFPALLEVVKSVTRGGRIVWRGWKLLTLWSSGGFQMCDFNVECLTCLASGSPETGHRLICSVTLNEAVTSLEFVQLSEVGGP